jgi:hypothetical protein
VSQEIGEKSHLKESPVHVTGVEAQKVYAGKCYYEKNPSNVCLCSSVLKAH